MTDVVPIARFAPALLEVLASRTDNGVIVCGPDRRIQWVNAGFTRLTGYGAAEVIGLHPGRLLQGEQSDPRTIQELRSALSEPRSCTVDIRNYRKDGSVFWNHLEIHPVLDPQGGLSSFIALVTDIDPAKQALESLSIHGERLEWALSIGDTAVWEWDLALGRVWSSQRAKTMLGYQPHELIDTVETWEGLIHPEEGAAVEASVQHCLSGESPLYRHEYRLRHKDGSWRWILDQGRIVDRDAAGNPLRMVGTHTDTTARHQAATALAQSEARLHKVAGQVPGMLYQVMLQPDGSMSFPYASEGILPLYGITPQEAARSASAVFDRLHPGDRERVRDAILASARDLSQWDCEYRYCHPDGRVRWLHGHGNPERLADGAVLWHGYNTDISERRARETLLTKVAAHVPGMLYQFVLRPDGSGAFPYMSQGGAALYGIQPGQAAASWRAIQERVDPEDRQRVEAAIAHSARTLTRFDCEYRIVLPDGRTRWLHCQSDPEAQEDGVLLWHGYISDVSERKRVEDNLRQALHDAEQATRSKSAFLATMSHEIRTPLNGVIGMVELMRMGEIEPRHQESIATIHASANNLLQILNDILDFSKLEEGAAMAERVAFAPAGLVEDAMRVVQLKAREKGLALRHALAPDLPAQLLGDPSKLRQILFNLLANAVKFTSAGSVDLRLGFSSGPGDGASAVLDISVADTGIGMDQAVLARLFQPFTQADSSMSRRFGGSGLGLAISRGLAVLMGGTLEASSVPGQGSTFRCRIPVALAPALPPPAAPPTPASSAAAAAKSARWSGRVLVVEDNAVNQEVARAMLSRLGMTVTICHDGASALAQLAATGFDAVFMDCMMPVMDGLEATRRARALGLRLPIIAMTANSMPSDREACLKAGMDDYLAKPITLDRLKRILERFLPGAGAQR
jgi:PAS domain S-box-containing protein